MHNYQNNHLDICMLTGETGNTITVLMIHKCVSVINDDCCIFINFLQIFHIETEDIIVPLISKIKMWFGPIFYV